MFQIKADSTDTLTSKKYCSILKTQLPSSLTCANCVCQEYWYEFTEFPPTTSVFEGQKECEQRRK